MRENKGDSTKFLIKTTKEKMWKIGIKNKNYKEKTVMNMVTVSTISIITLKVNV